MKKQINYNEQLKKIDKLKKQQSKEKKENKELLCEAIYFFCHSGNCQYLIDAKKKLNNKFDKYMSYLMKKNGDEVFLWIVSSDHDVFNILMDIIPLRDLVNQKGIFIINGFRCSDPTTDFGKIIKKEKVQALKGAIQKCGAIALKKIELVSQIDILLNKFPKKELSDEENENLKQNNTISYNRN